MELFELIVGFLIAIAWPLGLAIMAIVLKRESKKHGF
jgi:hypothetical protein